MIIDIAFVIVIILAIFKGLSKGLIVAVFSFLALIIGLAAALKLSAYVASLLGNNVETSSKWLPLISFLLVFIVVILLVGIGARILKKTVDFALLGWFDRMGGMILYIVIYTIIFSIVLFFAEKIRFLRPEAMANSEVYRIVSPWGPKVINNLGILLPFFKDMFSQLEAFFRGVVQKN